MHQCSSTCARSTQNFFFHLAHSKRKCCRKVRTVKSWRITLPRQRSRYVGTTVFDVISFYAWKLWHKFILQPQSLCTSMQQKTSLSSCAAWHMSKDSKVFLTRRHCTEVKVVAPFPKVISDEWRAGKYLTFLPCVLFLCGNLAAVSFLAVLRLMFCSSRCRRLFIFWVSKVVDQDTKTFGPHASVK